MTSARSDFLSFARSKTRKLILCSVYILGIIYLFLSEWEEIPFLAPAHKFQSKLRKNKREAAALYMAAGCRGILFTLLYL